MLSCNNLILQPKDKKMFLKRLKIPDFKVLQNIDIEYERHDGRPTYPVISLNGGGKSTLLQFIFTMLHCSFVEKRKFALDNLLSEFDFTDSSKKLASFTLEYNNYQVELNFTIETDDENYRAMIDYKELEEKKKETIIIMDRLGELQYIEQQIKDTKRVGTLIHRKLRRFIRREEEHDLIIDRDPEDSLNAIELIKNRIQEEYISDEELERIFKKTKILKSNLEKTLYENSQIYIHHINDNKNVLICEALIPQELLATEFPQQKEHLEKQRTQLLEKISNQVFLAAPRTQIFHFLTDDSNEELFEQPAGYSFNSYDSILREIKEKLSGFFTYEFASNQLIIDSFKQARDKDFEQALLTGEYGKNLEETKKELSNFLTGKEITVDGKISEVIFKEKNTGYKLLPRDLSHGELKKLSIFIWVKRNANKHSSPLFLMDEVDIGLHPSWQYEISDDLQKWGKNSQFIIATHSPQIISAAHHRNLVVLNQIEDSNCSTSRQYEQPFVEPDLNTVIKTIMGSDYVPKKVRRLRKEYLQLIENRQEESERGKELKARLLEHESEQSAFLQEMKFLIQFRD